MPYWVSNGKNIYMADQNKQKGDVIFPKKEDDGELLPKKEDNRELLSKIPSEISDVGDVIRATYQEKADELMQKLAEDNESIRKFEK